MQKHLLTQQYTGLIFFFLSFEKPDCNPKKAEASAEGSFPKGIFFLNFQDLYRQISDLSCQDSQRFSQALELLNASFLREELSVARRPFYPYRKILFGTEKLLVIFLALLPLFLHHMQTAAFFCRYWPFLSAGLLLVAGTATLCWYSNYRFHQAVHLPSYRSILSKQTDPFSIHCTQDHFWGRQQVYLKNTGDRTFSYIRGCIHFGDQNTLIHTVSFALEMISPRRAVLLDTLYAAQDPIYPQKIHWDEISVDIQFLLEGDCSPAHQKQTVYQSHRTYFAVLNYFHYWHILGWRLPFETTWLTQEFFYRVKTFFLYWPQSPRIYAAVRSPAQIRFSLIRMCKYLFLAVFTLFLSAFLLAALVGLFLFAGFYLFQVATLLQ